MNERFRRRVCAVVLAGLLQGVAAQAISRTSERPQIVGRVVGLGACAAGTESDPCPRRPLFSIRVILSDEAGERVASKLTRTNGRFAFRAAPGNYTVEARAVPGYIAGPPRDVKVTSTQSESQRAHLHLTASNGTGVVGQATQSPTCPGPQRPGQQCVEPLDGARIHVEDENNDVVASFVTGRFGYFAFPLTPGTYRLVAEGFENQLPSPPPPVTFTVESSDSGPHHFDRSYDTGIR